MEGHKNRNLSLMDKNQLKKIKLLVFDIDGILVPRGTRIQQKGNTLMLQTKVIETEQINQIRKLNELGFQINISSGRALYMLRKMFSDVLEHVSFTYENGSASWHKGKICQHVNSLDFLAKMLPRLKRLKHKDIKGFEPKEFIITIHCKKPIKKIESMIAKEKNLYALWNGEAYDIGLKDKQTKARGLKSFLKAIGMKHENALAIGDNYNDRELLSEAGVSVTADKQRCPGDYYIPLSTKKLPAKVLMNHIIRLKT
jgi:hydroxymethylpyrimidine pyrophosphatase-like HAD family hydrolase